MSKSEVEGPETTLKVPDDMEYIEECEDGFWILLELLLVFG
jgi:hypothetical protein